jgi:hypothetical protein
MARNAPLPTSIVHRCTRAEPSLSLLQRSSYLYPFPYTHCRPGAEETLVMHPSRHNPRFQFQEASDTEMTPPCLAQERTNPFDDLAPPEMMAGQNFDAMKLDPATHDPHVFEKQRISGQGVSMRSGGMNADDSPRQVGSRTTCAATRTISHLPSRFRLLLLSLDLRHWTVNNCWIRSRRSHSAWGAELRHLPARRPQQMRTLAFGGLCSRVDG